MQNIAQFRAATAESVLVLPVQSHEARRLKVTLTSHAKAPVKGRLESRISGGAEGISAPPG